MPLLLPGLFQHGRNQNFLDDCPVDIFAAQIFVAAMSLPAQHTVAFLDQRHIESSAAKIVDQPAGTICSLPVEPVGDRRGNWLLQQGADFETRKTRRAVCRLGLRRTEVRGNGDDGCANILVQKFLYVSSQLFQNLGGRTLRGASTCLRA